MESSPRLVLFVRQMSLCSGADEEEVKGGIIASLIESQRCYTDIRHPYDLD